MGDNDSQGEQSAYWLNQISTWFGFGHTYIVQPGSHSEKYWTAHLSDYLRFYAHDWLHEPYTPTPRPTATITRTPGPAATIAPTEAPLPLDTTSPVETTETPETETPTP